MKKLLAIIAALSIIIILDFGVKQSSDQAGDPPIGGFAAEPTQDVAFDEFTTMGNPPIGG